MVRVFGHAASTALIILAEQIGSALSQSSCGELQNWGTTPNTDDHAACHYRSTGNLCGGQFNDLNKNYDNCKSRWQDEPLDSNGFPKLVTKGFLYNTNLKWEPSISSEFGDINPDDGNLWITYNNDNTKWTLQLAYGESLAPGQLYDAAERWCSQNSDVTEDRHVCPECGTDKGAAGKRECRMFVVHYDGNYVEFFTENYCDVGDEGSKPWYQQSDIYGAKCANRDSMGDECSHDCFPVTDCDCKRTVEGSTSSLNEYRYCKRMYYDARAWGGSEHQTGYFCNTDSGEIDCTDTYDCPVGTDSCKNGRCANPCASGSTFVPFTDDGRSNQCEYCPYPTTNPNHVYPHYQENACDGGVINCPAGSEPTISQGEHDQGGSYWLAISGKQPDSINTAPEGRTPNGMCDLCPAGKTSSGGMEPCQDVQCPGDAVPKPNDEIDQNLHYLDMTNCAGVSCGNNPCQNGASCTDVPQDGQLDATFSCDCAGTGFQGTTCSQDVNECDPNNDDDTSDGYCFNDATCTNGIGNFSCACTQGWMGDTCGESVDDCELTELVVWVKAVQSWSASGHPWRFYEGSCSGSEIEPDGGYDDARMNKYPLHANTNYRFKRCSPAEGDTEDGAYFRIFKVGEGFLDTLGAIKTHTASAFADGYAFTTGDLGEEHRAMQTYSGWTQDNFDSAGDLSMKAYFEVTDNSVPSRCSNNGVCTDGHNAYTCDCTGTGYEGFKCEDNVDECTVNNNPCDDAGDTGATCMDTPGSFTCDCTSAFDGNLCQNDVNECDTGTHACQHSSPCENNIGGYTCNCEGTGFTGKYCHVDINECDPNNDNDLSDREDTCPQYSSCDNTFGSYNCICEDGLSYNEATNTCEDINECELEEYTWDPCQNGGTCVNVYKNPTFACDCADGFTGPRCYLDKNECDENTNGPNECADVGGYCSNKDITQSPYDDYKCFCKTGYIDASPDGARSGSVCEEIDECAPEPCQNGGSCTHGIGWYSCNCAGTGFDGDDCENNIDDCTHGCSGHGDCTDGVNSFDCACNTLEGTSHDLWKGDECDTDVDECASGGVCDSSSERKQCTNSVGGFECLCKDLCKENVFVAGDGAISCGYNGPFCEDDIDECSSLTAGELGCDANADCVNTPGSWNCVCKDGFTGDGNSCAEIDECTETTNPAFPDLCDEDGTASCTHGVNSRTCTCKDGYKGDRCEIDINDCLRTNNGADLADGGVPCEEGDPGCANPCKNNAPCTDLPFDFSCDCDHETAGTDIGWEGKQCDESINNCIEDPCCDTNTQKWCTDTTAVTGAICSDGFTDDNGVFNHNHRTCDCSNTNPPMFGDSCQLLVVQGCMDDEKINYDPDATHDDYGKCKEGDDVYETDGFKDRGQRLSKWKAMQERKYIKSRADGKDYSDKSKRKEIRKADRIAIKQEDYSSSSWSKLTAIGFGNRPKRLEVGTKNKDEPEKCAEKVAGGNFVSAEDDCVTTVLDEEDGEGDSKTLTRRALPDELGSWQVVGKTIDGTVKPVIKQERTEPDAYTMWCWEDDTWTQETPNLSEGADYLCSKTRHRVLVGSVTDYPAPCDLSGCTSEQKTEAYRNRDIGAACDGAVQDPDRDFDHGEIDTATCKTLGCTLQEIVDSFYFIDECPNPE